MRRRIVSLSLAALLMALFHNAVPLTGPAEAASPHANLTWKGPSMCVACHTDSATQVHASVHYQWKGQAQDMIDGAAFQGKYASSQMDPNYGSAMNGY